MNLIARKAEGRRQAVGIDVGGTNLRAALIDEDGRISTPIYERVITDRQGFAQRIETIVGLLDQSSSGPVGIGLPGRVDVQRNRAVSAGYLDIAELPIPELLGGEMGRVVRLDNDAAMALRAEMAIGAAQGFSNVVLLTIGTGIGGACAMGGKPVQGHSFAGQLGHITVHATGGALCKCGRYGCVETTSSGSALGRLVREAGLPEGMRAAELLQRGRAGDALALTVLRQWAGPLRCAIETLIAAIDPDLIVLGGGLGAEAFAALDYAPFNSEWFQRPIRAAILGDDAGMIGAGLCALAFAATQVGEAAAC
ncbi:ROK family protein [Acidisoma cellulosilytica]|uniref:ROK family protein n=1 Tax=Acidisoma cellulosilyticum TaxID=2802395 RepID=A0A963Z581_9PROT|nr:ROK family protein [Acidisoma cellulosilyticum]MCB8882275.1 ROK family protein [Acidisoma cellulosilyticum]